MFRISWLRGGGIFAGVLVILSTVAVAATPASPFAASTAFAKCAAPGTGRPGDWPHSRWVGSIRYVSNSGGVIGDLLEYDSYVASIYGRVSAWVQAGSSSGQVWASSGWVDNSGGSHDDLAEFRHSDGTIDQLEDYGSVGDTASYQIWEYSTIYNAYARGQYVYQEALGVDPDFGQIASQTDSLADQMPGGYTSGYHMTFRNVQIEIFSSYEPFAGTAYNNDPGAYGQSGSGPTAMDTWDWACAQ